MSEPPVKREQLEEAAKRALEKQPDQIRLLPVPQHGWSNTQAIETYAGDMSALGFADAGTYTVDVLPVVIQFLLKKTDHVYAVIYEHPKAGVWLNLVILYEDGRSMTFSTTADRGLEKRPGHPTVHSKGATAAALYTMTCQLMNEPPRKPVIASTIPAEFEKAWSDGVHWRKSRGFSVEETASVLLTRDGKNMSL